jgi:hypothetical protein
MPARAVAAIAASLALPALAEERAAQLAEAEGLVTHLTSLVLVDEAGEAQEGIPANRKIALPHPRAGSMMLARAAFMPAASMDVASARPSPQVAGLSLAESVTFSKRAASGNDAFIDLAADLSGIGSRIDWDIAPNRLLAGDLSALDRQDAGMIARAAALPEAIAVANRMTIDPVVLIVALIARSQSLINRSAARISKAIFGDGFSEELRSLAAQLGLG